jgi:hypothetical protein
MVAIERGIESEQAKIAELVKTLTQQLGTFEFG